MFRSWACSAAALAQSWGLIAALTLSCCHTMPTSSSRMSLKNTDLVDLARFDRSLVISLEYKKAHNIAKRPLYHPDFPALLHRNTATRLKNANRLLRKQNLRLVIWDAYRPQETQWALWDACGHDDRYVANPARHPSLHSHGCAVDVSLIHLDGSPAAVPTDFDDFSPRAASDYVHPDPIVQQNMRHLKEAMWASGFGTLPQEWWHFMDKDYQQIPVIQTSTLPPALQSMIQSTR
jgi:D-alanyl-D-alanine dipeptidase